MLFFHFLLHEAGFTADLDGSCEVGRGPTETPIRSCPYLFCVGIVSPSECPSRRRTHTTTGRRDGTARTGGVETKKEGTTQILPTFATYLPTYLPTYLAFQTFLPTYADIATNLYLHPPSHSFFALLLIISRCLFWLKRPRGQSGLFVTPHVE